MTEHDLTPLRISLTAALLRKKEEHYHRMAQYGTEQQRLAAKQECDRLRGELDELKNSISPEA
ncbi:MAG: hypothetical protein IJV58_04055 [Oscillospiraceae bacterium]|nr:hypothetical protein [Oscillospiraceae bacterium]